MPILESEPMFYIAVPVSIYPKVAALVADTLARQNDIAGEIRLKDAAKPKAKEIDWADPDQCRWLRRELSERGHEAGIKMLDLAAESPGQAHTIAQIVEKTGIDDSKLRGALITLTRVISSYYEVPAEGSTWPVKVQTLASGRTRYVMSSAVAESWNASKTLK